MASEFGETLRVSIFGQSHGEAIGVVIENLPAGETIDPQALSAFLKRRAPGQNAFSTPRREADEPRFLSGLTNNVTNGFPLCAVIENTNKKSGDYANLAAVPRPGHADYTARMRYGESVDMRGGGHFSGRLTAPLCIAGGIAKQILSRRGIECGAHILSVGAARDIPFDPVNVSRDDFALAAAHELCVLDEGAMARMKEEILSARAAEDSVGGSVECAVTGLPAGLGDPMFDGVENRFSRVIFGVPAIKSLEFGAGCEFASLRGSESNDAFCVKGGRVMTETNRCGGILGGITTGMPLLFRAAFKPTPSIAREQKSVDLHTMAETTLRIVGRHDPCIVTRGVVCVEAAAACAALDLVLSDKREK